jgi:hypothetical protein
MSEQITSFPLKISSLAGTAIVDAAGAADGLAAADGLGDASGEGDAAGATLAATDGAGEGEGAAGVGVALPEQAARTTASTPASANAREWVVNIDSSSCDGPVSTRRRRPARELLPHCSQRLGQPHRDAKE